MWSERPRDQILIEEEKAPHAVALAGADHVPATTASAAATPDSQAVIRRMRVDPLSRDRGGQGQPGRGRLLRALAGKTDRKSSSWRSPRYHRVETANFWVRRDDAGSQSRQLRRGCAAASAQGSTFSLGRDEATLVRNGAPADREGRHPAARRPAGAGRTTRSDVRRRGVTCAGRPVADAVGYWLSSPTTRVSRGWRRRWSHGAPPLRTGPLEVGSYYWRVAALDKFGLPGGAAKSGAFMCGRRHGAVSVDRRAGRGQVVARQSPLSVRGESEPDASLELNGSPLDVAANGRFGPCVRLSPGPTN